MNSQSKGEQYALDRQYREEDLRVQVSKRSWRRRAVEEYQQESGTSGFVVI